MTIVDLDVGGTKFRALASTLSKAPYFDALLHHVEHHLATVTPEGAFFVDRSPNAFAVVLDFLRSGRDGDEFVVPAFVAADVLKEFTYVGLDAQLQPPSKGVVVRAMTQIAPRDRSTTIIVEAPPDVRENLKSHLADGGWHDCPNWMAKTQGTSDRYEALIELQNGLRMQGFVECGRLVALDRGYHSKECSRDGLSIEILTFCLHSEQGRTKIRVQGLLEPAAPTSIQASKDTDAGAQVVSDDVGGTSATRASLVQSPEPRQSVNNSQSMRASAQLGDLGDTTGSGLAQSPSPPPSANHSEIARVSTRQCDIGNTNRGSLVQPPSPPQTANHSESMRASTQQCDVEDTIRASSVQPPPPPQIARYSESGATSTQLGSMEQPLLRASLLPSPPAVLAQSSNDSEGMTAMNPEPIRASLTPQPPIRASSQTLSPACVTVADDKLQPSPRASIQPPTLAPALVSCESVVHQPLQTPDAPQSLVPSSQDIGVMDDEIARASLTKVASPMRESAVSLADDTNTALVMSERELLPRQC